MIKVNRYSDFTLQFKMADAKPLPQYPFSLIFQTTGGLRYYVDSEDKALFVRSEDNMSAVVVFDFAEQHNLPVGELKYTLKASLPNNIFPDGYQDINEPQTTGVELWDGASDFAEAIECDVILPYVKGEAGAGVPSGGSKGQVLTKKSDEDQDLEWTTPQGGGADMSEYLTESEADSRYAKKGEGGSVAAVDINVSIDDVNIDYATIQYVDVAIAQAITNTLNMEV